MRAADVLQGHQMPGMLGSSFWKFILDLNLNRHMELIFSIFAIMIDLCRTGGIIPEVRGISTLLLQMC